MLQPPSVFGTGIIITDPDIKRGESYHSVWFYIGVYKGRYMREGQTNKMLYHCHIRCKVDSTLPQCIIKGNFIRFEGTLIHTYKKISDKHHSNYYYIDLKDDGTGIQLFSPVDKKVIINSMSIAEADAFHSEASGQQDGSPEEEKAPWET